ncbi:metallophosphoesterase [Actinosynnema mirum]|uniref:Metallophosphoesterase n=1 Tax=Actinosynnema mirum (strain ATCC 29888 / DSM 43827 / JCM 3225 / NBRC 14064 / NCIMB 13271 / NRRL B-12336 / IMRU 3971 / 101) TaxID=446462 RepID=C6WAT1_ACTMD|nr:metallophosphoesterase [Actinosynnema mirum]ACU37400.1 metallophosphoesterase [Actinosynnema mirum DSM 43827]
MIILAHFSDTHFDGGDHAAPRAERVVGYLRGLARPVDAAVLTGDVVDNGLRVEYEEAARVLGGLGRPLLALPGNHDSRSPFREVLLGEGPGDGPVNRVARVGEVVLALCDSTVPGQDGGALADETLEWLDAVLAEAAGAPTLVCLHHPPVPVRHPVLDPIGLDAPERLARVVRGRKGLLALLCGHSHSPMVGSLAGVPVLSAPGVVSTLAPPWEGEKPNDRGAPPALAFHVVEDGQLTTHYRLVP